MAYSDADLQVKTGSAAFAQCQANFLALTAEALTIAAVKTFSSSPVVPTPTTDMQASTKKYVDDTAVALTGNQTVAGIKTFSTPIAVGSGGTGASAAKNTAGGVVVPTGAVNAASGAVVLDANSKISVAQLGAWVDKSGGYDTQQAATDGFLLVLNAATVNILVYSDSSNPPTTVRGTASVTGNGERITITIPIKKNDYWKVTGASATVYWIPMGS